MNLFAQFTNHILAGGEGVFFSTKNDVVGHKVYVGIGDKLKADFNTGPFPLFSTINFTGQTANCWHFTNFKESDFIVDDLTVDQLETLVIDLDLSDLSSYATETQKSFIDKVKALQQQQIDGEFWVTNFTQNLTGNLPPSLKARELVLKVFYEFLKLGKNHCGGVVVTGEQIFCSLSPETFLVQSGKSLKTFPIKGTGTKDYLIKSTKEAAELHMITDLMRNDLGQICDTVNVVRERYLTPEQNFYHARAEVEGVLTSESFEWEQYQLLLPAGSISGAPKDRVLKALKQIESFERGFYTGTFGVRLNPQKSIFNILIRTLFADQASNAWSFPVGAGITIDSDPQEEWAETLQKAEILKDCLKR